MAEPIEHNGYWIQPVTTTIGGKTNTHYNITRHQNDNIKLNYDSLFSIEHAKRFIDNTIHGRKH